MLADDDVSHFERYAGTEKDLNHVLSSFQDSEHEISTYCDSRCMSMTDITSLFQNSTKDFLIMTLNTRSINAKFNNIFPIISNLSAPGLYFGAICIQETWLTDDADMSLLQLPGYQIIHQGSKCTRNGGTYHIPKRKLCI